MQDKPKYYNEARNRASQKYNAANLEQVNFRVHKGEKAILQEEASKEGLSLAQYIIQAVNEHAGKQILTPANREGNPAESDVTRIVFPLSQQRLHKLQELAAKSDLTVIEYIDAVLGIFQLADYLEDKAP